MECHNNRFNQKSGFYHLQEMGKATKISEHGKAMVRLTCQKDNSGSQQEEQTKKRKLQFHILAAMPRPILDSPMPSPITQALTGERQ